MKFPQLLYLLKNRILIAFCIGVGIMAVLFLLGLVLDEPTMSDRIVLMLSAGAE